MKVEVEITGGFDSPADYTESEFLRADEQARQAISKLFDAGATISNVEEAVQGGLEDADSAN